MATLEADGFMYGIGFFQDDEEQTESQSDTTTVASSISVRRVPTFRLHFEF